MNYKIICSLIIVVISLVNNKIICSMNYEITSLMNNRIICSMNNEINSSNNINIIYSMNNNINNYKIYYISRHLFFNINIVHSSRTCRTISSLLTFYCCFH